MVPMKGIAAAAVLGAIALAGAGCGTLHARSEPLAPRLEIPAPPPRVIVAIEPPEPPPLTSVDVPPQPRAAPPSTPVQAPLPAAPARVERREPAPPAAAVPARPAPSEAPPAAAPPLQTTTNVGEVEQRVRKMLDQATRDLGRIDYKTLNAEAKGQYDFARRFVQQAGEALTAKNFVLAGQLADKAATLAGSLNPR